MGAELEKEVKEVEVDPFDALMKKYNGVELKKSDEVKEPDENLEGDKKEPDTKEPEKKPEDEVAEEFDEIDYNKEKVKIPVADRKTYLQKGYNYDKVKQAADTANKALQRAAKIEGFDKIDDYLAELDNREKAALAEKIAEADGDPAKIDEIIKNHPMVKETQEERQRLDAEKLEIQQNQEFAVKKEVLKKEPLFKELEPELDLIMKQSPGIDPEIAFDLLVGKYTRSGKYKEIEKANREAAEKKAIADIHDKERRSVPSGGDAGNGKAVPELTASQKKIFRIFGV